MIVNKKYQAYMESRSETVKPLALMIGSRNSGKSRAAAQRHAVRMLTKPARRALVRNVADSIRDSSYKEIRDVVYSEGWESHFKFTVNPLAITCDSGSETVCKGCDDPEKLKSLAEVQEVWIEEFSEISQVSWETIDFSVRGESKEPKQITATMNPVKGFVKDYFFQPNGELKFPEQVYFLHTTWRDNAFRGDDWSARMEVLRQQNETLWKRVSEGLWTDLEGLVYSYELCDQLPAFGVKRRGIDFGFNDPSVVLDVVFHEGFFYVDELVYASGLSGNALSDRMKDAGLWESKHVKTLCDNAYKMTIDDLYGNGWNVFPCVKPRIEDSIQWLAGFPIRVTKRSVNVIREIESYIYAKDKAGKALNVPVDMNNHAMDAMRYAALDLMEYTGTPKHYEYESIGRRVSFAGGDEDDD